MGISINTISISREGNKLTSRTVPTKYKGFCSRLGPCGKSQVKSSHLYLGRVALSAPGWYQ